MAHDLSEKVIKLIAYKTGKKEEEITKETTLSEDLGLDSLDKLEMVMYLEEEFNINLTDEDISACVDVEDVIHAVNETI